MTEHVVVLVTCASAAEARRIGRALVEMRLAACVNLLETPVRSVYRWKGKVERASERLLLIKTSRKSLGAVRREVERWHSYEVPEVIALPIAAGSPAYLRWLAENVQPSPGKRLKKT
jgi:periplasmic divalent cation tolerance protein